MKCFMPHGSPTGLILNPGYDWKCQNWVAALDMGTEGRERGGPSDKYTLGTVLPASGQCHLLQQGVVSLLEPPLPRVHGKGWSGLSYLTSFRSPTPCDNERYKPQKNT